MKNTKTNIAFITSTLVVGGAERQWYELIKGVDKEKFNIIVICLYGLGSMGKEIADIGIKTHFNILRNRFDFFSIFHLIRILKKEKIDTVFLIRQPLSVFYGVIAARIARVRKIIMAIHDTGVLERKTKIFLTNKIFTRFINTVVAIGTNQRAYLIKRERIPEQKIVTIFNGVDIQKYKLDIDRETKKRQLGIPLDHKVVGIISRLHPCKRHDVFLKSVQLVLKKHPKTIFLVVGEGRERPRVEEMINTLGIGQNVRLLGLRKDIPEINKVLDVSVLSSDPVVETLPMVIIESMASSVPVVTTNVGSISDLIKDKENGFLVSHGSPDKLAKAISDVLENARLAEKMGKRGHEIAAEKFSYEKMVEEYEGLFHVDHAAGKFKKMLLISEHIDFPFDEGFKNITLSIYKELRLRKDLLLVTKKGNDTRGLEAVKVSLNKLFLNNKLTLLLKDYSPDIILYIPEASCTFNSFVRARILKLMNKSSKVVMLAAQHRKYRFLYRILLPFLKPDLLFLLGRSDKPFFEKMGMRVKVLPPAVDLERFFKAAPERRMLLREKYGIPKDKVIVFHAGHIKPNRNLEYFIDVQKIDNVQAVIVNSRTTQTDEKVKALLEEKGIIIIDRYLPDIQELYQLSDVYVFPVLKKEGAIEMPLSVLEAMACNLTLVTTSFGELTNYFKEDAGFRYFSNNKELVRLIGGISAREEVRNDRKITNFTWKRCADEIITSCNNIL